MPSKKKYVPKSFESLGQKYRDYNGNMRTDTSANIYSSMLMSDAYKDLTYRQKQLYTYCKDQYYGCRKPKQDSVYKELGKFQGDEFFYMNYANLKQYGIYKNGKREFYEDMKILEEHGFIKTELKGGSNGHSKSIYSFSDCWHNWKKL